MGGMMKTLAKLSDEIPITREGLETYIDLMSIAIKPIAKEFHRMDDLLTEAKLRLSKMGARR